MPHQLDTLRRRLQSNLNKTPLFDTTRFSARIEAASSAMNERYRPGFTPDHIEILDDELKPQA